MTGYRVPFDAGSQELTRLGNDGRVYVTTETGEQQYLETAPPLGAVHGNPGFEDETAGIPDLWDFFWANGSPVVASESSVVYSGERSLKVTLPPGGAEQIVLSDIFDVAGGDRIDFSTFIKKTAGSPKVSLGILSRNGGSPYFFDGTATVSNENTRASIGTDWGMPRRTAIVSSGHTKARIFFRVSAAATEACMVYLDLTASAVTASEQTLTTWAPIPLDTDFNAVASWAAPDCRRQGDELVFRGLAAWTGGSPVAAGSVLTTTALAEEFRPAYNRVVADSYIPAPPATAAVGTTVFLRPDGHIQITTALPVNASLNFDGKRVDLTA